MGQNEYLRKKQERERLVFEAGMMTGAQMATDYVQMALRDAGTMGKDVFGRGRVAKLFDRTSQLDDHFHPAFSGGVEADYLQEQMDGVLKEIWGDDLIPFRERYPWMKQFGYLKPRKGWVK